MHCYEDWSKYPVRCLAVHQIDNEEPGEFFERKRSNSELELETTEPKKVADHAEKYTTDTLTNLIDSAKLAKTFDEKLTTKKRRRASLKD